MHRVFSCHECKELAAPCVHIIFDADLAPDRCNYSTGSTPSKWVPLEASPAKEQWETVIKSHNNGSTFASQIADEIDAEVQVVKNGSAPLDLSKLSHWSRQLRTCR